MTQVFLAGPAYEAVVPQALPGLMGASTKTPFAVVLKQSSILPHTFNSLYCDCVNSGGYTHFAMHHADVEAPPGWLDTLLEELEASGADVLSAVVPIKDYRGLTSTGLLNPNRREVRRLTMVEAATLPETFRASDLGHLGSPAWPLAVNTGLWVARLDAMRDARFPGFSIDSGIEYGDGGEAISWFFPEDWKFAEWAFDEGLDVAATRKVAVVHHGRAEFRNDKVWGKWPTDLTYLEAMKRDAKD